jgi:formylglycine-generating enzyme required for sulfatase activity
MPDLNESRKPRAWPLIAITLLVGLLSAFLYVKWSKRERLPMEVKNGPGSSAPTAPEGSAGAPTGALAAHPPDPKEGPYKDAVLEAQKARDEKRWADARKHLAAARVLRPDQPELKTLEEEIRKAEEAEAELQAQERRAQDKDFVEVREKVERDRGEDLWDGAFEKLEKLEKDHPGIVRDSEYAGLKRRILELRAAAEKIFQDAMAKARSFLAEGRAQEALTLANEALRNYPEKKSLVREFKDRASATVLQKSMVRVACNTPCWIGSDENEDERPMREVRLAPFYIDKYEVTNDEYHAFVVATDREPPPFWPQHRPPKGLEKHPVVRVSWKDAADYAKWALKRLPTREEWEVAARGPDRREYPWGNAFTEKENVFHANTLEYWQFNRNQPPGTTPVDAFDGPNNVSPYGVYGMGGNVWEWTATSVKRATGGRQADFYVMKGGSFMTTAKAIRCATFLAEDPSMAFPDVGFRCVCDSK